MRKMQMHIHRSPESARLRARVLPGMDQEPSGPAGTPPTNTHGHTPLVHRVCRRLRGLWDGLLSLSHHAAVDVEPAHLPVLPGEERAGVRDHRLLNRISIPWITEEGRRAFRENDLGVDYYFPNCFISIGPGSPELMLAHDLRITLPATVQERIHEDGYWHNEPVLHTEVGYHMGRIEVASITAGKAAWEKALNHGRVRFNPVRPGTLFQIETMRRETLLSCDGFIWDCVERQAFFCDMDVDDYPQGANIAIARDARGLFQTLHVVGAI